MKHFLQGEADSTGLEIYKFVGDGWILFFPPSMSGTDLVNSLETLSATFQRKMEALVRPYLQSRPSVGLTFGVDRGPLVRLEMLDMIEYVGRSLNVAARLQAVVKDDPAPAYKVLFFGPAFSALNVPNDLWRTEIEHHRLRNIRAGESCKCVKLYLKDAMDKKPLRSLEGLSKLV